MSSAPAPSSYIDVALVAAAAPALLPAGVPAFGYAIGAVSWIALRGLGVAVDRYAQASSRASLAQQLSLRLGYRPARVLVLVSAVILAMRPGRDDGLTALLVITFSFTVQLVSLLFAVRRRPGVPPSA